MNSHPSPIVLLLNSRKFLIFAVTTLGGLVTYFATKYLAPSQANDVAMVLSAVMAFAGWYIKMIKDEDVARIQNPPVTQTTIEGTNPKVTTTQTQDAHGNT